MLEAFVEWSALEGFYDIYYNFVISPFGVFGCRGWSARPENISEFNGNFIHVGIVNYTIGPEEWFFNETMNNLVRDGNMIGRIAKDPKFTEIWPIWNTPTTDPPPKEPPTTEPATDIPPP